MRTACCSCSSPSAGRRVITSSDDMIASKTVRLVLFVALLACCAMMIQARPVVEAKRGRKLSMTVPKSYATCSDMKAARTALKDATGYCKKVFCDQVCYTLDGVNHTLTQVYPGCEDYCNECYGAALSCPADNSVPKDCVVNAGQYRLCD